MQLGSVRGSLLSVSISQDWKSPLKSSGRLNHCVQVKSSGQMYSETIIVVYFMHRRDL